MEAVANKLAKLLVQDAMDSDKLKAELNVALTQDRETYSEAWSFYEPRLEGLSNSIVSFAHSFGGEVRQPFAAPGSVEQLKALAAQCSTSLHESLEHLVVSSGGTYQRGPEKTEHRIKQKVTSDYRGDYSRLLDVERGMGLFGKPQEFSTCLNELPKLPDIEIARVKDRLTVPLDSGYRDLLVNVRVKSSGFVAELQLTFTKVAEIKSQTHRLYELSRQMILSAI